MLLFLDQSQRIGQQIRKFINSIGNKNIKNIEQWIKKISMSSYNYINVLKTNKLHIKLSYFNLI